MNKRNGGIDALRCLSMMMVVMLHVMLHGGALRYADMEALSLRTGALWIMEVSGICAVNCFGMISGYLCVSKKVRVSSVIKLWLQVVCYYVGVYIVWGIGRGKIPSASVWMKGFTPITRNTYWYFTSYVCLSFLMPMLNLLLRSAGRMQMRRWLILLLTAICFAQLVLQADVFTISSGYTLLWLVVLYLMGGYFRLHAGQSRGCMWLQRHGFAAYGALCVAGGLYYWCRLSNRFPFLGGSVSWARITAYDSPLAVAEAICLFAACSAWEPKGLLRRFVLFCAPAAFSAYLIHTHPTIWKRYMADSMASFSTYPAPAAVLLVVAAVLAIFVFSVVVERIRAWLFDRLRIHAACDALGRWLERMCGRLLGDCES